MCPCNAAPMISEHLLQHYPLQITLRKTTWAEDLPLTEKLYVDLDLSAFLREAGVSIWPW